MEVVKSQGKVVREAGEVHLYSGVFSVVEDDSAKFNLEDNKEETDNNNEHIVKEQKDSKEIRGAFLSDPSPIIVYPCH